MPGLGSGCVLHDGASSHGAQKITLRTEFWKDLRAREGEEVLAVNQELRRVVEKLLLSSLKLVPRQPLAEPKTTTAPESPALVLPLSGTHGK